jgi:hypothetical protein
MSIKLDYDNYWYQTILILIPTITIEDNDIDTVIIIQLWLS